LFAFVKNAKHNVTHQTGSYSPMGHGIRVNIIETCDKEAKTQKELHVSLMIKKLYKMI
jgi:hypothetical protein